MRFPNSILVVIFCISSVLALLKTKGSFVLHEKRGAPSHGWTKRSRAFSGEPLPIRIGLTQNNLHRAEELMLDVSDPTSPNFGQHWSAEKVANTFAPSKESIDEVVAWLVESGVDAERHAFSTGRNWIHFNATVYEAEQLFNTKYYYYQHDISKGVRMGCEKYYLPKGVREHVDFVMPTIQLEGIRPLPNKVARGVAKSPHGGLTGLVNCYERITIECIRALYQFGPGNTSAPGNEIGIYEWANYLQPQDLALFFKYLTTQPIPNSTHPEFVSIDGGGQWKPMLGVGSEVALDVQAAYSIVYPQGVRLYQLGRPGLDPTGGIFDTFLDALDGTYCTHLHGDALVTYPEPGPLRGGFNGPLQCGGVPSSNVLSISWGYAEAQLPPSYQTRQCHEWMKLGLQGVSVLFASGDSGVASRCPTDPYVCCLTPAETGPYLDSNGTRFVPGYPVNCPWVTVVGGAFLKTPNISDGEVAVGVPRWNYYSGGGFSNIFSAPKYQSQAVSNYLTNFPPPYGDDIYNKTGRAYPDIAAVSLNLSIVYDGRAMLQAGTSMSTPIVGSIVTLLNEARIARGKKAIGFLNPILYAHPEAFNDITEGGNPGCGTDGFAARPGWDPVTGLGTPIYPKLEKIFLDLP